MDENIIPECANLHESYTTVGRNKGLMPYADGVIYWHIDPAHHTDDLSLLKMVATFEKCFDAWKPHLYPIRIQSTGNRQKAAIILRFMHNGDSGLPYPFRGSVLAYAFLPEGKSLGYHSDIYFNDHLNWLEMHRPGAYSLFKVAVHEVGHSLGLRHSTVRNDIMYPTYQPNDEMNITIDSIGGIEELFAKYKKLLGGSSIVLILKQVFPTIKSLRKPNRRTLKRMLLLLGLPVKDNSTKSDLAKQVFNHLHS